MANLFTTCVSDQCQFFLKWSCIGVRTPVITGLFNILVNVSFTSPRPPSTTRINAISKNSIGCPSLIHETASRNPKALDPASPIRMELGLELNHIYAPSTAKSITSICEKLVATPYLCISAIIVPNAIMHWEPQSPSTPSAQFVTFILTNTNMMIRIAYKIG